MRTTKTRSIGSITAAALIVGLGLGSTGQVAAQPAPRSLIEDAEAPDLFLLSTGDVIGYLDPCG